MSRIDRATLAKRRALWTSDFAGLIPGAQLDFSSTKIAAIFLRITTLRIATAGNKPKHCKVP
jgi:hypothetical protein